MNYRKKGLKRLLEMILRRQTRRLVLTHKNRLLRFGAELVFAPCELQGVEVVVIHKGEQPGFEEELAQDVLEIITVFSARLYGACSGKHKRVMETLRQYRVIRTHKIALDRTPRQARRLAQHGGHARVAYNHAPADFKDGLEGGEWRTHCALRSRWNRVMAARYSRCEELSQNAAKYAIIALGVAVKAWRSERQKNGFPRFRSRCGKAAFRADNGVDTVRTQGRRIRLPRIGSLRTDAQHKANTEIVQRATCVVTEDLNVDGMVRNRLRTAAACEASTEALDWQIRSDC